MPSACRVTSKKAWGRAILPVGARGPTSKTRDKLVEAEPTVFSDAGSNPATSTRVRGNRGYLAAFLCQRQAGSCGCYSCSEVLTGAKVPKNLVGPPGVEPGTSRLSGVRSNRLSYGPWRLHLKHCLHRAILNSPPFRGATPFPAKIREACEHGTSDIRPGSRGVPGVLSQ